MSGAGEQAIGCTDLNLEATSAPSAVLPLRCLIDIPSGAPRLTPCHLKEAKE